MCLVFVHLISMCLGLFLLGFILYGTLCASWTWLTVSFSTLGEIFNYNHFKNFLILFLFFFWDPHNLNVGAFYIVPEVSETISLVLLILFALFRSSEVISTILSSRSLIHSSGSGILLLIPSRVVLISVFVLSLYVYSWTHLIDSCIFSILFSRFLIIFTIIILNYFSGSLPISYSFIWASVFLVCYFICVVFLCLFIILFLTYCVWDLLFPGFRVEFFLPFGFCPPKVGPVVCLSFT